VSTITEGGFPDRECSVGRAAKLGARDRPDQRREMFRVMRFRCEADEYRIERHDNGSPPVR
jgi:hypothetical protein